MKVLIVNTSDIEGGAARAAYRLHQSLLEHAVNSQMLVMNKSSDDFTVIGETSKFQKVANKLKPTLDTLPVNFYKNKSKTLFSCSWLLSGKIIEEINALSPDVVHLHWINGGMIRIEDLPKINAPIVWSLHDMWAFTGGCHYDEQCGAYKRNCGECKVLGSKNRSDLSTRVFNRKKKAYSQISSLAVVAVSRWLQSCAVDSSLFAERIIVNLPNPIDTSMFKPFDKKKSRELWNLPINKKLVLFGAMGATSDPRKGFEALSGAFEHIKGDDVEFVVFGSSKPLNPPNLGSKTHYLGQLSDDISLVTLYSAADVMVVPSLQEAFGQTASESMACGTPVVGFSHTGLLDIVEHKTNGYLAKALDSADLAYGIEWILDNSNYDELCKNSRNKVLKSFDYKVVAPQYVELYERILND